MQDGNRAVSIYLVQPTTAGAPVASAAPAAGGKSRMTAGLLAFMLGNLGIHKFYLGEKGGVTRIILSCTIIGLPVAAVLALLDAIKLFGMSDDEFNRQYNS